MGKLPPEIRRALEVDRTPAPDPERMTRLAQAIEAAAGQILASRRRAQSSWWEIPASWAATLIPVSLVLAAASIIVLWRVAPAHPATIQDGERASIEQAVNELVAERP